MEDCSNNGVDVSDSQLVGNIKTPENPSREESSPVMSTKAKLSDPLMEDIRVHESPAIEENLPVAYKKESPLGTVSDPHNSSKYDDKNKQEETQNASTSVDLRNYSFGIDEFQKPVSANESDDVLSKSMKAVVGNTTAVKILVNKNRNLLYAEDVDGLLPIHRALINSHKDTFLYLLSVTKGNQYPCTFTGNMGVTLLSNVIFAGYFDIALDLVARYPDLATTIPSDNVDAPLMAIARKADAFESGCRLSFFDSLIYKYVPLKLENLNSNKQGGMNFFDSVLQEIGFVVWKVVGRIVPHITHIQKIKLVHHQALALVKCLCQEISALNLQSNSIHYSNRQ